MRAPAARNFRWRQCGRAKFRALTDIRNAHCSSRSRESVAATASSGPSATTPPPAAATNRSALRSSGPGIASNITIGSSDKAASAVVSPPGFVTSTEAVCINAATSFTQPSTRSELRRVAETLKFAAHARVVARDRNDLHWLITLAELRSHLIHARRSHPTTHQEYDWGTIIESVPRPRGCVVMPFTKVRVSRNSANNNLFGRRSPGAQLSAHRFVRNCVNLNLRLDPNGLGFVVCNDIDDARIGKASRLAMTASSQAATSVAIITSGLNSAMPLKTVEQPHRSAQAGAVCWSLMATRARKSRSHSEGA